MITEDYVSFEVAKLLKKEFNEYSGGCYDGFMQFHELKCCNSDLPPNIEVATPTLQTAMKWLRNVHNLFIQITVDFSDGAYPMYDVHVVNLATCTSTVVNMYDRYSYKEACEAAIKYCLENLI